MEHKTPLELVQRIVAHHGPILGKQVVSLCASVGYTNKRSTGAVLFNARRAKTLTKDAHGRWTCPKSKTTGQA